MLFRARDLNRRVSREAFPYYRCPACGLVFLSPIPDDLSAYYPVDYYSFPGTLADVERAAEAERYKIEIVERFRRAGRLLEIGPSWGAFLNLAKRSGFEVEAIEMDARCCRFMRETIGVTVIESDDPVAALRDRAPYDVIALWHVIEHVPDPWALLRAAAAKLGPQGVLVVAAPNPSAAQFKVMGRRWPHVDAPRHVALLPLPLLTEKAGSVGLTREWASTRDPGSVGWNVFGWEFFFGNLARTRVLSLCLRLLGKAFAKVVSPLERAEGAGSAYTAVFRKET